MLATFPTPEHEIPPTRSEAMATSHGGNGGTAIQRWWRQSGSWQWIVLAAGMLIRLRAYWHNPSLWGDEAAVVKNLLSRDFWQLTLKLDDHQGAPVGFLWLSKAAIERFGIHEYSLRLVPLVAGLLVLPLALWLLRKCFQGWPVVMGMVMVSGSSPLIYFCSELKQYSLDVACALLMIVTALNTLSPKNARRQYAALAVLGSVLTWFSHSLILVLAGIGVTLATRASCRRQWGEFMMLAAVGACWLASYAVQFSWLLRHHADDPYLMNYWSEEFLPWPVSFRSTVTWLAKTAHDEASYLTPYPLTWISIPLIVLGAVSLSRRAGTVASLLLLPVVFGVLAAALHKFPIGQRLWLFAVPAGFIMLTEGLRAVCAWPPLASRAALPLKIALVVTMTAPAAYGFYKFTFQPPTKFAFREALEFYVEHARPSDPVFVDKSHDGLVEVYGNMRRFEFLSDRPLSYGTAKLRTPAEVAAALQPFADEPRLWVLASKDEVAIRALLRFCDEHGRQLDGRVANGSAAVLYEFSPPRE